MDEERKNNKLQAMSDFATIRFELRKPKIFLNQFQVKKQSYSRFSKSKPKVYQQNPPSARIGTQRQNVLTIHELSESQKNSPQNIQDLKNSKDLKDQPEQPQTPAFRLRFLEQLSSEHLLIGNEYQLDMIKVRTINSFIDVDYKWSVCPSEALTSLSIDTKYSMIAISLAKTVDILKYNLKREHEVPSLIIKHHHSEEVQYVRFVRNMSLFVVLQTQVLYYRINFVCEKAELDLSFTHRITLGPNFKLYHCPQAVDNSLVLYFYQNRVKPQQRSKFGLWMQTLQSHTNQPPTVSKMILNYNIKVSDRKEFSIYNYNKDICFIKYRYDIVAAKNGFIIDQTNSNFHGEGSFIDMIEHSRTVLHFRRTFVDIYRLSMNFQVKPEIIKLNCLDSIAFTPPPNATLFKIIQIQPQTYAIFYQLPPKNTSTNPQIEYMFSISQQANLKSKIDMMYPTKEEIENGKIQEFQDTYFEAKKLGMNIKEVYYELWKRSDKSNKIDFQILVATEDYPTIEKEIEKKLKCHSMSIREAINIYAQALDMLKNIVTGTRCTVMSLIYYSSCQFTLKKFQMLRYLRSLQQPQLTTEQYFQQDSDSENVHVLVITIKDYYEYNDMSVVNEFLEQLTNYLQKKKKVQMQKMKAIIKYFKLIFRMAYTEIIDKVISLCKLRFMEILEELPELLPFKFEDSNDGFGMWEPLSQSEMEDNLFLDQLMTIDNRSQIQEFPNHIWFRRHINNSHGVILIKKQNIEEFIRVKNNPKNIFYKVLCLLYNIKIYDQNLRNTIHHIEDKYPLLPPHLKGKFQLYVILYQIFESFHESYDFQQFLRFKEIELFKMYFERQKAQKGGFILKKIMPLYQKFLKDGKQIFNQGLYNYFSSDNSSVGDLKSILNKLNNQKNEFHISAQKMYQVLVNAIMKKIMVGSDNDTPIDQILVYIENIPFPIHNHSIMMNLQYIQQINYEAQILNKIKVNMTLQEIVDNPRKVIQMMVSYEIDRHDLHLIKSYRSLKVHTYKILAEVQCRKSNIYGSQEPNHSFKIYLINIMKTKEMIQLCSKLLKDQYLVKQFSIYTSLIQEVVITLYHWKLTHAKMSNQPYLSSVEYLEALGQLLEAGSSRRQYIQYSIKYAKLLSFQNGYKIEYPLFLVEVGYPTLKDFISIINGLSAKEMVLLNLKSIFQTIIDLKKLQEDQILQSDQLKIYQKKLKVQIYEQLIIRLIQQKELKSALDNLFILLTIPRDHYEYNIVLICLIIQKLLPELLKNTIHLMIKLVSYYYRHPKQLADIIKHLFSQPFNNQQIDDYLSKMIQKYKKQSIFSPNNPIINQRLKDYAKNTPEQINNLFELCLDRIIRHNELYLKNYHLHIMFRLMCHNPLTISKWIYCKKNGINIKTLRSFMSYMALENLFQQLPTLQHGRQIFQIIAFQYTHNIFFSQILKWRNKYSFQQMNAAAAASDLNVEQDHAMELMNQCIEMFEQKMSDLQAEQFQGSSQSRKVSLDQILIKPQAYYERPLSHYVYKDKDDGYQNMRQELQLPSLKRFNKQRHIQYQKQNQLQKLSRHSIKGQQMLLLPGQHKTRARKYSEYFPQMLDIEQIAEGSNEHIPYTPPYRRVSCGFADNQKIIQEDDREGLGTYGFISIEPLVKRQSQNTMKQIKQNTSLQFIDVDSKYNSKNNSLNKSSISLNKSQLSDIVSNVDSVIIKSQNSKSEESAFQFKINVVSKTEVHRPAAEVCDQLFATVADKDGKFDLNVLKIEARKEHFRPYLSIVLQQIYHSLTPLDMRLNLILTIAQQFKNNYFEEDCVLIFKKLLKSKIIPNLSFKITEIVPIQLILLDSQVQAFKMFKKKIMPYIDSINIYQAMELTKHLFQNTLFVDKLLLEFIVLKIRDSKASASEKERNEQIVQTLFDCLHSKAKSINKICEELTVGDDEDKKIASTLRRLSLQSQL